LPRTRRKRMKKLAMIVAAILVLIATATIVVSLGLVAEDNRSVTPAPTSVEQHPAAPSAVEGVYVLPDDGSGPLIEELDAARSSISIEIYLLTDDDVIGALFRARDRGVTIRVLLEEDPYGGSNQQPQVFDTLTEGGIQVRWNTAASRFSHVKMIVIDQRVALIMNLNLTYSALTKNRELAVITTDPDLVDHASRIFENDWQRKDGEIPGPLTISPDTSRTTIIGLIESARTSIDVYAEVISDREFISAIERALDRGVRVRIIMTQSYGQDMLQEPVGELVRHGAELHILAIPYIHAKLIMVDGQQAFIGSQNYTSTSMDQNREVGVVISGVSNLERLARVFDRDFAMGIPVSAVTRSLVTASPTSVQLRQ
jgi:phosphatidylserine/phosphatidylglycerophosphate/cardiolipin synthase-like enzyme